MSLSITLRVALAVMAGLAALAFAAPAHAADVDLLTQANVTIDGAAAGGPADEAGYAVSGAGDVNDDEIDDVVIVASGADAALNRRGSGIAYVIYGSSSPVNVDLASLGSAGFRVLGAEQGIGFASADAAGDFNGDGFADIIVGSPDAALGPGEAYVVFGAASPATVDLRTPGTSSIAITGESGFAAAGTSVAGAGDVNADGRADVIVGSPYWSPNEFDDFGTAYVVYGSASPTNVSLLSLGTQGFRIRGQLRASDNRPEWDNRTGWSVDGAGDVNGDNVDDVVVGAPDANQSAQGNRGAAFVVYGSASPTDVDLQVLGTRGFRMNGVAAGDLAGIAVSRAGDVNADGKDDVIIGAESADSNGNSGAGAAYVVYGNATPATVELGTLGLGGFRIDGAAAGALAGHAVAGGEDFDGDGIDDVLVGAPGEARNGRSPRSGSAFVVFGSPLGANVDLANLGTKGFSIDGAAVGDEAGFATAPAGDFNDDGGADILVGSHLADRNARTDSGSAYVVYGDAPAAVADTTAPTTTDDVPSGWRNAPVEVTLTATDDTGGSGVDKIYYTTGSSPAEPTAASAVYDAGAKPTLNHGERIRYFAVDEDGNAEAPHTSVNAAQVDSVKPTTTASEIPATYRTSKIPVTLTPTDEAGGSGVAAVKYQVVAAGGAEGPATDYAAGSPPELGNGERLKYWAIDTAGNVEAAKTTRTAFVLVGSTNSFVKTTVNHSTSGASTFDTEVGDFNDDGRPDIATLDTGNDRVHVWFKNAGSGFTQGPSTDLVAADQGRLAVGDLDGDGDDDIAASHLHRGTTGAMGVEVLYAGGGGFTKRATALAGDVQPSNAVGGAAIADMNADGRNDIVLAEPGSAQVSFYLQSAPDTFTRDWPDATASSGAGEIAVTALDADGRPDLVVGGTSKVSVLRQSTPGGFTKATPDLSLGWPAGGASRVALGDVNGDGRADLATNNPVNTGSTTMKVFLRNATGFGYTEDAPVTALLSPFMLEAADFSGDTVDELAVVNFGDSSAIGRVTLYTRGGSGFTQTSVPHIVGSRAGDVADFDGDGRLDVVAVTGGNGVSTFTAISDTTPPVTTDNVPATRQGTAVTVTLAATDVGGGVATTTYEKLDADGNVIGTTQTYSSSAMPTLGNGERIRYRSTDHAGNVESPDKTSIAAQVDGTAPTTTDDVPATYRTANIPVTLTAADNAGGSGVDKVYYTKGASPADPTTASSVYSAASKPQLANGERIKYRARDLQGNLEAVKTSRAAVVAPATNYFVPSVPSTSVGSAEAIAIGDFNDDGLLDLASTNHVADQVKVTLRKADNSGWDAIGVIATVTGINTPGGQSLAAGDVNGDGKDDLAVVSYEEDRVAVITRKSDNSGWDDPVTAGAVANQANGVAIGDVNDDGRPDLAVGSYASGLVVVPQAAGGTWGTPETLPGIAGHEHVLIVDMDDDGLEDLVVERVRGMVQLIMRKSDNSGWNARETLFDVGDHEGAIGVGDFNGDGKRDVAVTDPGDDKVVVIFRKADGSGWEAGVDAGATGSSPTSLAVGDLDGDGIDDLATANESGAGNGTVITRNAGNDGWDAPVSFTGAGGNWVDIELGDLDADGRADLVTAPLNGGTGPVNLHTAIYDPTPPVTSDDVPATRQASVTVTLTATDSGGSGVATTTYEKLDMSGNVIGTTQTYSSSAKPTLANLQKIRYRSTDSAGNVESPDKISLAAQTDSTTPTTTDDVPATYRTSDIPVTLTATDTTDGTGVDKIFYTKGTSPADPTTASSVYSDASKPSLANGERIKYRAVDFAGNLEAVKTSRVAVVLTGATNWFSPAQAGTTGNGPAAIATGDLNSDGRPDVATANYLDGTTTLLLKNAGAGFTARTPALSTPGNPFAIAAGDLNGDGRDDLAVAMLNGGAARVFFQSSDGTFPSTGTDLATGSGSGPSTVSIGDVSGDGRADLVVALQHHGDGQATDDVAVFTKDATGDTFTGPAYHTVGQNPRAVIADVTGDGHDDIVTANFDSDTVTVLKKHRVGSDFTRAPDIAVGDGPHFLTTADFDGDGRTDIAVANDVAKTTSVVYQQSNGAFNRLVPDLPNSVGKAIVAAELTGDALPDLAMGLTGTNKGVIYAKQATGRGFTRFYKDPQVGGGPLGITSADFDGDGRRDLATADFESNRVTLMTGLHDPAAPTTTDDVPSGWVNASTVSATLSATDTGGSGLETTTYEKLDAAGTPITGTLTYSGPVSLANGEKIRYRSTDNAGNVEADRTSAEVRVDTTAPTVTDDVPASYRTANVLVTLTAADGSGASGVAAIKYTKGTSPADPTGASGITYTGPVTLADGERIRYYAIDNAGNASAVATSRAAVVAPATNTFKRASFATGNAPVSAATGDVNADGRPDLAVAAWFSDKLTVLVRKSDNSGWLAPVDVPNVVNPHAVAVGDLNGDGHADLAAANFDPSRMTVVMRRPATDDWADPVIVGATGNQPRGIAIADLTGDGKNDVATADLNGNGMTIFSRNATNDGFDSSRITGAVGRPLAVALGDVDADGKRDVVTSTDTGNITVWRRNSAGTAFEGAVSKSVETGAPVGSVTVADVDGSGPNEIVTATHNAGKVSVFTRNAGNTDWLTPDQLSPGSNAGSVTTADINGDGRLDLLTAHLGTLDEVRLMTRNSANDGWSAAVRVAGTGDNPEAVVAADFTGDGRVDLATSDGAAAAFSVLTAGRDETAPVTTDNVPTAITPSPFTVTLTATDDESDVVLIRYTKGVNPTDPRLSDGVVYDPNNKPTISHGEKIRYYAVNSVFPSGLAEDNRESATLDSDDTAPTTTDDVPATYRTADIPVTLTATDNAGGTGVDKIFYTKGSNPADPTTASDVYDAGSKPTLADGERIKYRAVDHAGTLEAVKTSRKAIVATVTNALKRAPYATGDFPFSIESGDVNGDGLLDLATADFSGNSSTVLIRKSDNSGWHAPEIISGIVNPHAIAVGDVNGDGNADLAAANYGPNTITVVTRNAGNTGWDAPAIVGNTGQQPRAIAIADLNADGRPDLATANVNGSNSATIVSRKSDNSGWESPQHLTGGGSGPSGIALGDVNNDGRRDIVTANRFANTITAWLRNSSGGWSAATTRSVNGTTPIGIAIADFDRNGVNEIVTANIGSGNLSFFTRNAGNTDWNSPPTLVTTGGAPEGLALADVDGDGYEDVLAADPSTETVKMVRRNATNTGWQPGFVVSAGPAGSDPIELAAGDFNGDGRPDVASADIGSDQIGVRIAGRDTTAPVTTDNVPTAITPSPFTVTLTATDDESDVVLIRYTKGVNPTDPRLSDGVVYDPNNKPTISHGEKIRYYAVNSVFPSGLAEDNRASATLVSDATPPTIDVTSPTAAQNIPRFSTVNATFSCADAIDPAPTCTADVDGTPITSGSALPTQTVGRRTLTVRSQDAAGNVQTATRTFLVHGPAIVRDGHCFDNVVPGVANATLPQPMKVGGTTYTRVHVHEDGVLGFGENNTSNPRLEVLMGDVSTAGMGAAQVYYGVTAAGAFCVNWTGIDYNGVASSNAANTGKRNSFQLLLVPRGGTDFDIVYNFDQVQWQDTLSGVTPTGFWMAADDFDEPGFAGNGFLDTAANGLIKRRRGGTTVDGSLRYAFRNGAYATVRAAQAAADKLASPEGSPITVTGKFTTPDGDDPQLSADNTEGTFTDNGDGTWEWTYTPADEQSAKTVAVTAVDQNGETATDSFGYSAVNVAPAIDITGGPTFPESSSPREFTYTISDPGTSDTIVSVTTHCGTGGVKDSEGSGWFKCVFADGPASPTVSVVAKDNDGDQGTDSVVLSITNAAPTVAFTGPATRTVQESGSEEHAFAYTITDPDAISSVDPSCGAEGVLVSGSSTHDDDSGEFKCLFRDGPATSDVTVTATDEEGATSVADSVTVRVTVENVAPTLSFDAGETARTVDESGTAEHTFSYTISDPGIDGVDSVTTSCGVGGVKASEANDDDSGWVKCKFPDGPATPTVTAEPKDEDLAVGNTDSINVTVKNVAPTLSFADESREVDEHKTVKRTFTYSISDPGDDTHAVEAFCGANGVISEETLGSFKCVFKDGPAPSNVTASAKDSDFDQGATDTVVVTIKNVAPTVSFTTTDQHYDESGVDEHTFSYSITDVGDDTVKSVSTSCGAQGEKVAGSDSNNDTGGSFRCRFLDGPASSPLTARATDSDTEEGPNGTLSVTVHNIAPTLTGMTPPADSIDVMIGKHYEWSFTGTDPSPIDQASLKFVVDWGDGRTDTKASPMTHVYGLPGDWTVSARALDKDGALSAFDPALHTRPEYSGGITIAPAKSGVKKALMIGGTRGGDSFTVKRVSSTKVSVTPKTGPIQTFTLQASAEIVMSGSDGKDTLIVDDKVIQKPIAFGGDGDDIIKLENSEGIAVGGAGVDELYGDNGREMLYGGTGKDLLEGEKGEDVLVAGRVAWERATYPDRLALQKLRSEWIRSNVPYATRILRLRGAGGGRGSNGTMLLQNGPAGRTVFDDVSVDTLRGGTGNDWFLANTDAGNPLDSVDETDDETVSDVAGS